MAQSTKLITVPLLLVLLIHLFSVTCSAWPFLDWTPSVNRLLSDSPYNHPFVHASRVNDDPLLEVDDSVIDYPNGNNIDDDNGENEMTNHLGYLEDRLHGTPSNETGARVADWHEDMGVNPEELGEYAEGDMLVPSSLSRNGVKTASARWPNGVVPYVVSPYFNLQQLRVIHEAMNDYHRYTCVRFKPYTGLETDYVRITAGTSGCWSSIGRIGGRQDVNLQAPGCVSKKGTVIHELMHVVGFLHEQSRYERDQYVSVQWNNIKPGRESNFERSQRSSTDAFGVGYDYSSVMHYSARAFSRNGLPTIIPKSYSVESIGQREGFSARDIQKIRRMYRCSNRRRS